MKLLQDNDEEPNEIQRRIFSLIELQQEREALAERAQAYMDKVKEKFDKRIKEDAFLLGDMVLKWAA